MYAEGLHSVLQPGDRGTLSHQAAGEEAARLLTGLYPCVKQAAPLGTVGGAAVGPSDAKMTFTLQPAQENGASGPLAALEMTSLTAPKIVTVRKLCTYVQKNYPSGEPPCPAVEILCAGTVLPREMALMTVLREIWLKDKRVAPVVLEYRTFRATV